MCQIPSLAPKSVNLLVSSPVLSVLHGKCVTFLDKVLYVACVLACWFMCMLNYVCTYVCMRVAGHKPTVPCSQGKASSVHISQWPNLLNILFELNLFLVSVQVFELYLCVFNFLCSFYLWH